MWRHAWKVGKDLLCNEKGFTLTTLASWALVGVVAAGAGYSGYQSSAQTTQTKKATADARARADAQAKEMKEAQETAASQAQATITKKKKMQAHYGQTIYTSPMGLGEQASTARKTLLGQ